MDAKRMPGSERVDLARPPAAWPAYLRTLVYSLLVALLAIVLFNGVLDPYGAYRWVTIPALAPYREGFESRIARAEILNHERCELVVLGTSRAQIALDPARPAWGRPGCNLAVTGADISEVRSVLDRVLARGGVREIVWTLDFLSFRAAISRHQEFLSSRFNAELGTIEYHAGLLLGSAALRASWHTLRDYWEDRASPFHPLGWTDFGLRRRDDAYHARFVWSLQRDVAALASRDPFVYAPETVTDVWADVRRAIDAGIEVTLVVLPSHVLHYESLDRFGQWGAFERWRTDLLEARAGAGLDEVPLWDCTRYAGPPAERVPAPADDATEMRWHWDSAHVKPSLGDRVIREIRAVPGGDEEESLCARLEPATWPRRLERVRSERAAYRRTSGAQLVLLDEAELPREGARRRRPLQNR